MKFIFIPSLVLIFTMISCTKKTPEIAEETLPAGTVLAIGTFTSGVHPTNGTVKVIQDAGGKKHLVFQNFRSDNGPDLDVWLSPGTSGNPHKSLGDLKAVNGNFSYELSNDIDYTTNNRVLVWCVNFSVLFGYAILQ
jgi:hypothetical protein